PLSSDRLGACVGGICHGKSGLADEFGGCNPMNATEDPQRKLAPPVNTPYVKVLDLEQTLSGLTEMVDLLRTERDDLEIALTTAIEHGDAIESQLATANVQLQKEVLERRNVEKQLRLLVATITEKSRDLELV